MAKEIVFDIPFSCPINLSFKTIEFDNFVYAYKKERREDELFTKINLGIYTLEFIF